MSFPLTNGMRLLVLTLGLLSIQMSVGAQQHVNLERGLNAHSYLSGDFDHVNLYNGNLTLTIPIGQSYKVGGTLEYSLTLTYNSNAWYFKTEIQPNHGDRTRAEVNPKANAGMGWMLSLGALYPPNTAGYNDDFNKQLYVAPDGSEHLFYSELYPGRTQSGMSFTNDGTFLRLRNEGGVRKIEFPNGQIHTFGANNLLSRIEDRFGNVLDVDTSSSVQWLLSEKCNTCGSFTRQHKITFSGGRVDEVQLDAFTGDAIYKFHYTQAAIKRHNKDTWVRSNYFIDVWRLSSIELPANGGFYDFGYNSGEMVPSGLITSATLPTRGHFKWDYQTYTRPVNVLNPTPVCQPYCPDETSPISSSDGILYKKIYRKPNDANPIGQFDYTLGDKIPTTVDPRGWTSVTVKSPEGDETVNYFNISFDAEGYNTWEFGLPFNPIDSANSSEGDLYLSQEIYKGTAANGKRLRTVYVKYEGDLKSGFHDRANNRMTARRIVYEDGLSADTFWKNWNGLGKFQTEQTGGTFAHGNNRTTTTDYSFTMPGVGAAWILSRYTSQIESEGSLSSKVSFCFSASNGFLEAKRIHKGSGTVPQDIFIDYGSDGNGNVSTERFFGGDKTANAGTNPDTCVTPSGSPEYEKSHTYSFGSLATSKVVGQQYFTTNNVINQRTGLITSSTDTAGVVTNYDYDALGRIKKIDSFADEDTYYTYTPAAGATLAQVTIERKSSETDTTPLAAGYITFDNFGRKTKTGELVPTGPATSVLSEQETKYNALGLVTSISEFGDVTKTTQYVNYDPFGRAAKIIRPDGFETIVDYTGVSSIKRTVKIGTSRDAAGNIEKKPASSIEFYDRQGRLQSVQQDSGPGNAPRATNYQYDIGNRLSRVAIKYDEEPPARVNAALGAQATASSTINGNYPVAAVTDGDRTGASWGAGGGWGDNSQGTYSADWVRVDFNALKEVTELRVYTLRQNYANRTDDPTFLETFNNADNTGEGIVDFDIQYLSGQGWKTVPGGRVTNNNLVCRRVTFPALWTKAIRVAVHKSVTWTNTPINFSRIVEVEAYGRDVNQKVWVDDSLPAGAVPVSDREGWNWVTAWPWSFSGSTSHQSANLEGMHQHYFQWATEKMTVNAGDTLFAYVYINPSSPPRQVMLQWHSDAQGWNHRAYWGENLLPWGTDGTINRRRIGNLPAKAQWVRLEVPADMVGLEGQTVNGMAFSLFDGKATWDYAGKSSAVSTTAVNLARQPGAVATASSQVNGNYPVSAVNDGDRTGRNWGLGGFASGWNDGTEGVFGSDWVQVDFAGARTIDEIGVFTLRDNFAGGGAVSEGETFSTADNIGNGTTYFEAQYWDGSRWQRIPGGLVGETVDNNRVWTKLSFLAITTQKIRVLVRDSVVFTGSPNNYSRIVEIEAWEPAPASDDTVGTQVRTFNYDNRGFLFSETHPEITGAVTYSKHDTMGQVGKKVEGGNTLLYNYDPTGRLVDIREESTNRLLKEFAYYDTNGTGGNYRLGKMKKATRHNWVKNPFSSDPNATELDVQISEEYTYAGREGRLDTRVTRLNEENTAHYKFNQTFQYDELGNLDSQSYPECQNFTCVQSGVATPRTVKYGNTNGYLTKVWRNTPTGEIQYASNISYHLNRAVNTVQHGNGVTDTYARNVNNNIPRPHKISFAKGSTQLWSTGDYEYDGAGNVVKMGSDWFTYDLVNRVTEGTAGFASNGIQRKQSYTYDVMGNVLTITTTDHDGTHPVYTNPVVPQTNRLAWHYDAAGNFLGVGAPNVYQYDPLNMMKKLPGKTYLYGPNDERMWVVDKQYNDLGPAPAPTPTIIQTVTLRGLGNEMLREYTIYGVDAVNSWEWTKDYIYREDKLLSSETPSGRFDYHVDHLGTPRIITGSNGNQTSAYAQYLYPYGAEAQAFFDQRLKFTGHERDNNLGPGHRLDYMHARSYAFDNGRFISVDPGRDFDPKQPQSWNRYSYVRGNPINATDPTGRDGENQALAQPAPTDGSGTAEYQFWMRVLQEIRRKTAERMEAAAREDEKKRTPKKSILSRLSFSEDDQLNPEAIELSIELGLNPPGVKPVRKLFPKPPRRTHSQDEVHPDTRRDYLYETYTAVPVHAVRMLVQKYLLGKYWFN